MEFRWVAVLALWTVLSGPLFVRPTAPAPSPRGASSSTLLPLSAYPPKPPAAKPDRRP
jgi:hypothetical protein